MMAAPEYLHQPFLAEAFEQGALVQASATLLRHTSPVVMDVGIQQRCAWVATDVTLRAIVLRQHLIS